jgi:hypothetical protein
LIAVAAILCSTPASAAGPVDLASLSIAQRATLLPPDTAVIFHGKTTTLGALRKAHQALLAHFADLGAGTPEMPPYERVLSTKRFGAASGGGPEPFVTPTPAGAPESRRLGIDPAVSDPGAAKTTAPPQPRKHISNPAPAPQPIDYVAACGKITLCVYVPGDAYYVYPDGTVVVEDPLLSPQVCKQDGGTYSSAIGCSLKYMTSESVSAFPGNPPDLQASINCPNHAIFSTYIDPLGAVRIIGDPAYINPSPTTKPVVCAVDVTVPS